MALVVWVGFLAGLATRWGRFTAAWGGPLDHRVAAVTLVAGLVVSWVWSMRDVRRPVMESEDGISQWDLAVRAFRKNRIAVVGTSG